MISACIANKQHSTGRVWRESRPARVRSLAGSRQMQAAAACSRPPRQALPPAASSCARGVRSAAAAGAAAARLPLWHGRPAALRAASALQQPQQARRRWLRCAASAAGAAAGGSDSGGDSGLEARLGQLCRAATNLFPLWVVGAALAGYAHPPLFTWFSDAYVTASLVACMLAMGLTLTFEEISGVFTRSPQLLLLGMVLQYSVLPAIGWAISRFWGLSPSLAIGVALVSCMPGGTASNVVALIAKGDMPLSIMMTTASTLMAVVTTPLLTNLLVGTLVPMDPAAMLLSVVQLVLAPVIVGTALNQYFPALVSRLRVFTPFLATLLVVMIVGSMISTNVAVIATSGLAIISAVLVLHGSGFGLGYGISKALGLPDKVCRTNSIEVGMQSSALAAVLAKVHFPQDPLIVAPCVLSACTHAVLGSLLAAYWNATAKD